MGQVHADRGLGCAGDTDQDNICVKHPPRVLAVIILDGELNRLDPVEVLLIQAVQQTGLHLRLQGCHPGEHVQHRAEDVDCRYSLFGGQRLQLVPQTGDHQGIGDDAGDGAGLGDHLLHHAAIAHKRDAPDLELAVVKLTGGRPGHGLRGLAQRIGNDKDHRVHTHTPLRSIPIKSCWVLPILQRSWLPSSW